MKLADLSREIDSTIMIHPLDSPAYLLQEKLFSRDEYNHYRLEIGLHTGTHIDAPMHMTENGLYINEYDLNRFCGNGVLIDSRYEDVIKYKNNFDDIIHEDDIILFYTGHELKYGREEYFNDHPVMDIELAEFLVSKKIKMAGFDLPSPDRSPYIIHKKLLENGIMIIENLRNMGQLTGRNFEIFAFPLNIKADSSIARVVAKMI